MREDRELQEYRDIIIPPDEFEEGFNWRTVIMALFVGFLMTPAQLYMQLVAGVELGSAAQWVTVILYVEIARRAFVQLKRPEIFVLFYMCGAIIHSGGEGLLWQQFLVQSEEIRKLGITPYIPDWYAPKDPDILARRSFFMKPWLAPIILTVVLRLISRIDNFGLGYILFRLTSDIERLPFPMAPVDATGMTALADASSRTDTWRWRVFSMGAMGGIVFGSIYLAVPNITGAIFSQPVRILPLPFLDLTPYTEKFLPAFPFTISFDIGFIIMGMVLPFFAMVGSFIGMLLTMIMNPLLYHAGVLRSWKPGIGAIQTIQSNIMDLYFSFGLGLSLAVAVIGFIHIFSSFRKKKDTYRDISIQWKKLFAQLYKRGDFPLWIAICIYLFSTSVYIGLGYWLVNYASGPLYGQKFPLYILVFYGFFYTPLISYVNARMEGIVGQQMPIPFVREATFILSGYRGAAIWFAPFPVHNYAAQTRFFKTTELTGTRISSLIKTELVIYPIMVVGMLLFSQFMWSISNVPSELFPYANQFWELRAYQQGIIYSATLPGEVSSPFREAFKPDMICAGFGLAIVIYYLLICFNLPVLLIYGVIRGLDQSLPHAIIPMFIGALLGRFYFRKRFGDNWARYRIVFAAGFSAGIGLITMLSLGIVFMSKSVIKLFV